LPKNIALLFDGTWNKPSGVTDPEQSTDTNVFRFMQSVRPRTADGVEQVAWYNSGVGTEWMNRLRGGAFGLGLDKHILDGYARLCEIYEEGDCVYVLGFSRGAYTARSVVGMLRKCGLLHDSSAPRVAAAYHLYRNAKLRPGDAEPTLFRRENSCEIEVHFLGVWDTVGALGIPMEVLEDWNLKKYAFHDTRLSKIVRNAFHALAIDEHRYPYQPTMWEVSDGDRPQRVEQVWFPGAHADVGGGYANQPLSNPPLRWMQRRARECGLEVNVLAEPAAEAAQLEFLAPATDSYAQFVGGAYAKIHPRHLRPIEPGRNSERIHRNVMRRLDAARYSPRNPGLAAALIREEFLTDEA
jgi:uncharacterized protein (DUF2235 family)